MFFSYVKLPDGSNTSMLTLRAPPSRGWNHRLPSSIHYHVETNPYIYTYIYTYRLYSTVYHMYIYIICRTYHTYYIIYIYIRIYNHITYCPFASTSIPVLDRLSSPCCCFFQIRRSANCTTFRTFCSACFLNCCWIFSACQVWSGVAARGWPKSRLCAEICFPPSRCSFQELMPMSCLQPNSPSKCSGNLCFILINWYQ